MIFSVIDLIKNINKSSLLCFCKGHNKEILDKTGLLSSILVERSFKMANRKHEVLAASQTVVLKMLVKNSLLSRNDLVSVSSWEKS